MMANNVATLMLAYKSILKKIEGGHSSSIVEYDYVVTNGVGEEKNKSVNYESRISWLNLQDTYESYNTKSVWRKISIENVPMLITQKMEASWSFQKSFNASSLNDFSNIESEVLSIIHEMKNVLQDLVDSISGCREMYIDLGGNDYWMVIVSLKEGEQIFEFMHFID